MLRWYALQVSPRLWNAVASSLEQRGFEVFNPVYAKPKRWADRIVYRDAPLFPGYMFCRFDVNNRYPAITVPGVQNVVRYGRYPQPIHDEEITNIRCAVHSGLARPWQYLRVGDVVRIGDGPMRGVTGILVRGTSTDRVVVSVSALHSSIAVEVQSRWLIPESAVPSSLAAM